MSLASFGCYIGTYTACTHLGVRCSLSRNKPTEDWYNVLNVSIARTVWCKDYLLKEANEIRLHSYILREMNDSLLTVECNSGTNLLYQSDMFHTKTTFIVAHCNICDHLTPPTAILLACLCKRELYL